MYVLAPISQTQRKDSEVDRSHCQRQASAACRRADARPLLRFTQAPLDKAEGALRIWWALDVRIARSEAISAEAPAQCRVQTLSEFDIDDDFTKCLDQIVPD